MSAETIIAFADALRTPLTRLKARSYNAKNIRDVEIITEHALRDIDIFISTIERVRDSQPELTPVSCGALMKDTVESVRSYASLSGLQLRVDDHASHQPILGNTVVIKRGLELMTKTLCDMASDYKDAEVILRADTRHGYPRLGVYRSDIDIKAEDVRLAKKLLGGARINAGLFTQLGALRIAVATELLESLSLRLRSAKSNGNHGLALQLLPSSQIGLF